MDNWKSNSDETLIVLEAYDNICSALGVTRCNKTVNAGKFSYTFTSLDALIYMVEPPCEKFGCRLRQFKVPISDRAMAMHTRLEHKKSGQFIQDISVVPVYEDPQETSKACTTAQRYGIDNLFMLVYEDNPNDNDSNKKDAVIADAPKYVPRVGKALTPKQQSMFDDALSKFPDTRSEKFKIHLWAKFQTPNGVITEEKLMPMVQYIQQQTAELKGDK